MNKIKITSLSSQEVQKLSKNWRKICSKYLRSIFLWCKTNQTLVFHSAEENPVRECCVSAIIANCNNCRNRRPRVRPGVGPRASQPSPHPYPQRGTPEQRLGHLVDLLVGDVPQVGDNTEAALGTATTPANQTRPTSTGGRGGGATQCTLSAGPHPGHGLPAKR